MFKCHHPTQYHYIAHGFCVYCVLNCSHHSTECQMVRLAHLENNHDYYNGDGMLSFQGQVKKFCCLFKKENSIYQGLEEQCTLFLSGSSWQGSSIWNKNAIMERSVIFVEKRDGWRIGRKRRIFYYVYRGEKPRRSFCKVVKNGQ